MDCSICRRPACCEHLSSHVQQLTLSLHTKNMLEGFNLTFEDQNYIYVNLKKQLYLREIYCIQYE